MTRIAGWMPQPRNADNHPLDRRDGDMSAKAHRRALVAFLIGTATPTWVTPKKALHRHPGSPQRILNRMDTDHDRLDLSHRAE